MPETKKTLDDMAGEIFELYQLIAAARSRRPTGPDDLSETEFLTLDLLSKDEPLTIGDIQKRIGVVPAQMSRIVRALEQRGDSAYVECRINPLDRRRIDVYLTDVGRKAFSSYRTARLSSMHQILEVLSSDDRTNFMRILKLIQSSFQDHSDKA